MLVNPGIGDIVSPPDVYGDCVPFVHERDWLGMTGIVEIG
jgi:hypothetical protein